MKQAKTLTPGQLRLFLRYVMAHSEHPIRDRVMVLLSYRAGLRAAEIAGLSWSNVTDALGELRSDFVEVSGVKRGKLRLVPMHPELFDALRSLYVYSAKGRAPQAIQKYPLMYAARGGFMTANHVTVHLWLLYRAAGFLGASSHSGRRTLITTLARDANNFDCSLKDVQRLAGHASIQTTEKYIEPSRGVRRMVRNL